MSTSARGNTTALRTHYTKNSLHSIYRHLSSSIVIYQHIFFDIHRTMQRHYSLCRCCRVVVYHSYIVRSCGFTVLRCAELWCIHVMLCRAVVYNCCTECGLFLLCCTGLWYVTVTLFRIYHCYIVQTCDLVSRCI